MKLFIDIKSEKNPIGSEKSNCKQSNYRTTWTETKNHAADKIIAFQNDLNSRKEPIGVVTNMVKVTHDWLKTWSGWKLEALNMKLSIDIGI